MDSDHAQRDRYIDMVKVADELAVVTILGVAWGASRPGNAEELLKAVKEQFPGLGWDDEKTGKDESAQTVAVQPTGYPLVTDGKSPPFPGRGAEQGFADAGKA